MKSYVSKRALTRTALAVATSLLLAPSVWAKSDKVENGTVMHTSALKSSEMFDRFIVRFRGGSQGISNPVAAANVALHSQGRSMQLLRRLAVGGDVMETDRPLNASEAEALMQALAASGQVESVEADILAQPMFTPNDTRYNEQWHYFETVGGLNLPAAWDQATGSGVVVAVIDTGSTSHSDLNANTVAGYDFISDLTNARDGNGRDNNPADPGDATSGQSSWHGTHVAGTIAAVTNNAKGVAGVAYNAKVQHVRVLGTQGGYTSDIADAIVWASGGTVSGVPANATPSKVINMSLGGQSTCSTTYQNAINSAVGRGTVVVVAAGNSNMDVANFTPASCNNVVAVASNDREGNRASYSNYGAKIDGTAPGGETATLTKGVLSTLNAGTSAPGAESYQFYQGTSMAAPHVAGVAALMLSVANKTPAEIESLLKSSTRALPGSCSGGCGAGIVDALAAVNAAKGVTPPPPPPTGGTLSNGVPVSNISATTGNAANYTMAVPAGSSNLNFVMSGGTGDADMYVKFGSAPTTSSYDCRPYKSGNAETCTFATPQTGTYYVMLRAYSSFSGVSLTGSYTAGGGTQPSFFENTADFTINDNSTIESPLAVSGRTGNAPSTLKVNVTIYHSYKGDLKVDLIAPDGSVYVLHNRAGGSADNIIASFTVNASSEVANGTWKLRVNDNANGDTGYLDKWSLQF